MNKFAITAAALAAGLLVQAQSFAQSADVTGTKANSATTSDRESAVRENWRSLMRHNEVPAEGCFHASYPNIVWESVKCQEAEPRFHPEHVQRQGAMADVTGNGNDYVLNSQGLISSAVGYFSATGVTTETNVGVPAFNNGGVLGVNDYTLQLNTNDLQNTAACNNHSGCTVWQQFVYSSDFQGKGVGAAYIQYWLINYGSCPSGYHQSGTSCYKNSTTVSVPKFPVTDLNTLSLSVRVTPGGSDVFTFTGENEAYVVTAKDSVLYIATVWDQVEFNVVGDHGGSRADFNYGSSITVNLFAGDGTTNKPYCYANNGTTGETNNLNLGSCTAGFFLEPYIQFTETLPFPRIIVPPVIIGLSE